MEFELGFYLIDNINPPKLPSRIAFSKFTCVAAITRTLIGIAFVPPTFTISFPAVHEGVSLVYLQITPLFHLKNTTVICFLKETHVSRLFSLQKTPLPHNQIIHFLTTSPKWPHSLHGRTYCIFDYFHYGLHVQTILYQSQIHRVTVLLLVYLLLASPVR